MYASSNTVCKNERKGKEKYRQEYDKKKDTKNENLKSFIYYNDEDADPVDAAADEERSLSLCNIKKSKKIGITLDTIIGGMSHEQMKTKRQ